tara:strand:- start:1254 stop:1649 length:396 start_codon:yes stop_codon:yes gene_type:complete
MGDKWEVDADTGDRKIVGGDDLNGDITAAVNSDVDDWNPTGLATANRIIVTNSGNNEITGITAPAAGYNQTIMIINIGSDKLEFPDDDSGSVAANRIINNNNKDVSLKGGGAFTITYVHSESRWFSMMDKA